MTLAGLPAPVFITRRHHAPCSLVQNTKPIPPPLTFDAAKTAEFMITGHYDEWVKVAKKELDPIQGMMVGKLKLEGDMTKIMRATKAAVELVNAITMMEGVEF